MAYDVTFSIPARVLGKADVEFRVKRNGSAFGKLKVSNGSAVRVPVGKQYGFKIGWKKFDALMQEHGRGGAG
jgi:hypothetical protein